MESSLLLIWLGNSIDEESTECQNVIIQLRRSVNTIKIFTESIKCLEFIESLHNEKACMIVSDTVGQTFVPRVHDMSQIVAIFILCNNNNQDEQWTKEWFKIKGICTEITSIYELLQKAKPQYEENGISMSFMALSADVCRKNLDQLDCSFMYTQILKEILLTIEFDRKHFTEFIHYCREQFADNNHELKNITKFEQNYGYRTPIWWYTCECFLYPLLNRALRTMDVDIIIKIGFFIVDLHQHIEKLHKKQFTDYCSRNSFTVYRGQALSKKDFDQMINTQGGLMAFNNFLSTSRDRNISLRFAQHSLVNPEMIGILFVMTIDPLQSTTPFASISDVTSNTNSENEVLFSMHTVFRINDIKSIDSHHRLYQVDLTLTNDNDKDLCMLAESIRKETEGSIGWFRLGVLLRKMGQFEKAEKVYQILLERIDDENEKGPIYDRLGKAKEDQGEYHEAMTLYKTAIDIHQMTLPSHHLNLSISYNNMGVVCEKIGQYSNALFYHQKALGIKQINFPSDHPAVGASYTNIGVVYRKMGDYTKALSYYEKSLQIKLQSLPSNHPDLAKCYINHGIVYTQMGEHEKALSYFEKAIEIQQQSLLPNHPDFSMSYNNIAIAYRKLSKYSDALSYYQKVLTIQQQTLPPNHPHFCISYNNIALVYKSMSNYSEALTAYQQVLAIQQQSLPLNHITLAKSYSNIGLMYMNMNNFSTAHSFFQRAFDIGQSSLPTNHPDLQGYKQNLAHVKENTIE